MNGKKLAPRVLYGDEGKAMEGSDTDFEPDAVRHRVASERPNLKRKYAASGLRDDRASMTKRSASKKVRGKIPVKIATQSSVAVIDSESDNGAPKRRRREVIDEHEVVLLDGEKSEMSGTDNEDADVSKCPEPLSHSGMRRRISLATSTVSPVNQSKTDSGYKGLRFGTSADFSQHRNEFNIRCENATPAKNEDEARKSAGLKSCALGDQSPTLRKACNLVSMFNSDSESLSQRSPPSTKGRLKRLRMSVSDSSQSEDFGRDGTDATLEQKDRYPAAATMTSRIGLGLQSTPRRRIVFESESDDVRSEPAASENYQEKFACTDEGDDSISPLGNMMVHASTLEPVESNEMRPRKLAANPHAAKKAEPNVNKGETECLENHLSQESESFLDDKSREFVGEGVINCDSPSQNFERDVVHIGSSSGEDDKCAERGEADASSQEGDDDEPGQHQIMTRSATRRALQNQRPAGDVSISDLDGVSDDSFDSSRDNALEVLSDVQVAYRKFVREEECTPVQRRSRSCFLRSGGKKYSITPESTPSPPSTKRRFRLCKLATKYNDNDDSAKDGIQGDIGVRGPQLELVERPGQLPDSQKTGRSFHEEEIAEHSQSSADLRTLFSAEKTHTAVKPPLRGQRKMHIANVPPVRRAIFQEISQEPNDDTIESEAQWKTQMRNPERLTLDDAVFDGDREKDGGKGTSEGVIDLVDDEDGRDAVDILDEAPESDSANRTDEIRNSSLAPSSSLEEDDAKGLITIDDDKPPPFNLLILCNPGESVKQMAERLGEEEIMNKVSEAQSEGREIVGGEDLGLDESFNTGVFNRFSKTIVAEQIGRERKVENVTEQALRGEYKFNYRGRDMRNQSRRGGRGSSGWYRGRRGGRRGGSNGGDGKGQGGRLANLRRRRS